jgi:uncharacterized protein
MQALSFRSPKTEVRPSPIHGRGLFATAPIARNEIVCIKGGYILDDRMLKAVQKTMGPAEIAIAEGFHIGPVSPHERDGGMIFSNHSCDPNIGVQGQIIFVAMRGIAAGEELTHDWAMTDDNDEVMDCRCGAAACRGKVTGQDWRKPELQQRYAGYISWYLERRIQR